MLDGFDASGVWGQIELRNEPLLKFARAQLRRELKSEARMRKQEEEEAAELRSGWAAHARAHHTRAALTVSTPWQARRRGRGG